MLSLVIAGAVVSLHSTALYALLWRARQADGDGAALAVAAICLGPSAAAWVLGLCWRVAPGLSGFSTVLVLLLVPAALFLIASLRSRPGAGLQLPDFALSVRPAQAFLFSLLLACIVYLVLRIPPYSNDPLEYAAVARLFRDTHSVALYPVLDATLSGGLYAPWTHPPGFPLLMTLAMLGGEVDPGTALKAVAALHVVLGSIGLALLVPARMRWVAVLSLTATPAYLLGVINGYVEVVRLTALIGVFGACVALTQARGYGSAVALGVLFGLGGFVHSLGILSTAFFLPVLLLLRQGTVGARIAWGAVIVVVQLLLLAPDLWANLTHFGVLLGDRPAIWQIPGIGRPEYFREFRSLSGPLDIVVWGLMQGFSQVSNFGVSYWIPAILTLWILLCMKYQGLPGAGAGTRLINVARAWPPMIQVSAGVIATFYALAAAAALAGSIEPIKNTRYVLTLQPFVAIVTAWLVLVVPAADRVRPLLIAALVACSLTPVAYMAERYPGLLTSTQSRQDAYFEHVHPEADAVRAVNRMTVKNDCPLLFKQADYALYGQHCYRSYLDHRFEDVYRAQSPAAAVERLRAHGVRTLMTPDYALPEIYNTAVGALLADPGAAQLRWSEGGYSAYVLPNPAIVPKATVKGAGFVPPAPAANPLRVDWAALALNRPQAAETDLVGVLCVETTGRGRIEVTTIDQQSRPDPGPMLRALRGDGRYVLAAAASVPKRVCVQQPARHTHGSLRVRSTGSIRVERIDFSWTLLPPTANKD